VLLRLRASDALTRSVRDELLSAIKALRGDLAVARFLSPPVPEDAAAPVARKAVSVTRDEDVHTRPTVVAPPPAPPAEQRAVLAPSTQAKLAALRARHAPAAAPAERKTPVGEGDAAPAAGDRESVEELTQVLPAGKRPTMAMRPGQEPIPWPELTGSQDETPARGTPTQPSPGPAPGKPSR